MSKEAVGQINTKIGSSEYWSKLNRSTILGHLINSRTDYQATLRALGKRASAAIEEIYGDLSSLGSKIRFLDSHNRKALAKQVEGLYDVCKMTGVTVWHNSECVQGLNLSMMSPWTRNFRDERGIERAIAIINKSRYSGSEVVDLLKEAAKWSIDSAAGRDSKKREFLESVAQGSISSRFLEDVAEEYQNQSSRQSYEGKCGHTVGSRSYMEHMETQVFGTVVSGFGNPDYERFLRDALRSVADQLERDFDNAIRENDYITDETAAILKAVVGELDDCGISTGSLNGKIEKLAWFVGGDPFKIRRLQQALNKLGYALTEDGVFGAKTLQAVNSLHEDLVAGAFPAVVWIDPLQSKTTGIEFHKIPWKKDGKVITHYASFRDVSERSRNIKNGKNRGLTVFRADFDEDGLLHHINTVSGEQLGAGEYIPSSTIQRKIIDKFNHMKINESTYRWLKDFDVHAKKVRVGGKRVLWVAGVVLEALELIEAIHIDTHDADGKIGKTTYSSLASLGGSWSLGALGAKGGAMLGATIGSVFPGPGTAIGGIVGGLVFGIAGSYSGSKLGEYVIDITMVE